MTWILVEARAYQQNTTHSPIRLYSVGILADIGKGVWSAAPANSVAAGARVPGHCIVATLYSFRASRGFSCLPSGRSVRAGPSGSAGGSNLGRQAAPACGHRGVASILFVSCVAQFHFGSSPFSGLKCIAGMKTTQCTGRTRFGPNPYWRSPHFRAEGMAGAMRLLQKGGAR